MLPEERIDRNIERFWKAQHRAVMAEAIKMEKAIESIDEIDDDNPKSQSDKRETR